MKYTPNEIDVMADNPSLLERERNALKEYASLLREQAKGAQGEAVGEIDWGEDGAFAEFYPDRDLPLGAKLYTAPRADVPDGMTPVPTDELSRLGEYLASGESSKIGNGVWVGWVRDLLSAAPSDGGEQGEGA